MLASRHSGWERRCGLPQAEVVAWPDLPAVGRRRFTHKVKLDHL